MFRILIFLVLVLEINAGNQCQASLAGLKGQVFGSSYHEYETPIDPRMANTNTFPFICLDIGVRQRYSWSLAGIYDFGDFLPKYCAPQCLQEVTFSDTIKCSAKEAPMKWKPSIGKMIERTNCSNLNLPIQDKTKPMILTIGDGFPPLVLKHLSTFPWRGIRLYNQYEDQTKIIAAVQYLLTNVPTIEELYVTAQFPTQKPLTYLWDVVVSKDWKVISIDSVKLPSNVIFKNTALQAVRLYSIQLDTIPSWVGSAKKLQYLQIDNDNQKPLTGLDQLNNLPLLEHLLIPRCSLTSLPFSLANSPKLVSLDLSCNSLKRIPSNFFSSNSELRFLSLAGNLLESLDSNLFARLTQLKTLDIGRQVYDGFSGSLYYLNRISPNQICRSAYDEVNDPKLLEFSPNYLPKPDGLMVLEMMQQYKINMATNFFQPFKNLMALSIGNMNLTSLHGLGIDKLLQLKTLRASGNRFMEKNWLPNAIVTNLKDLQVIYVTGSQIKYAPASMLALAKAEGKAAAQFHDDIFISPIVAEQMMLCDRKILENVISQKAIPKTCSSVAKEILKQVDELIAKRDKSSHEIENHDQASDAMQRLIFSSN